MFLTDLMMKGINTYEYNVDATPENGENTATTYVIYAKIFSRSRIHELISKNYY
jgi:hypothetical protein